MIKKLFTVFAALCIMATYSHAQWQNMGGFPDTTYKGGTHGIAVDPDGKVWVSSYYKNIPWVPQEGDTIASAGILVFNADGTPASFSPIFIVNVGGGFGTYDTLTGACRGLGVAADGNILYVQSSSSKIFKINYQTGEGMARHDLTELGSSPTAPSASSDGTVYVGPVVGGGTNAIAMYDGNDLSYLGNAVVGPPNIARTMEVSADGNAIYWMPFTGDIPQIYIFTRPDEFSDYELTDSTLQYMSIETSAWNPATGDLWVSNDERGTGPYTAATWYGLDVATMTLTDSFNVPLTGIADEYPRGLDFSPDGMYAYVGFFAQSYDRIIKFYNPNVSVQEIEAGIPTEYKLGQNYPNPFNPTTNIQFVIPENGFVSIRVYDLTGAEVTTLVSEEKDAGAYNVTFDASDLASGLYIYTISVNNFTASQKMMLLK